MFENFTREQTAIIADALSEFLESKSVGASGQYRNQALYLWGLASAEAEDKADNGALAGI